MSWLEKILGEKQKKPAPRLEGLPKKDEDIPAEFRGSPAVLIRYREAKKVAEALERKKLKDEQIDLKAFALNGIETDAAFSRLAQAVREGVDLEEARGDWERRRTDLKLREESLLLSPMARKMHEAVQPGIKFGREILLRLLKDVEVTDKDRELLSEEPLAPELIDEEDWFKLDREKPGVRAKKPRGRRERREEEELAKEIEKEIEASSEEEPADDFVEDDIERLDSLVPRLQELLDAGDTTLRVEGVSLEKLIPAAEEFLRQKMNKERMFRDEIAKRLGREYDKKQPLTKVISKMQEQVPDEWVKEVFKLRQEMLLIVIAIEGMKVEQNQERIKEEPEKIEEKLRRAA